ncbi:hypothetical protein QOT17_004153 [Balamuthia mandrillaris]
MLESAVIGMTRRIGSRTARGCTHDVVLGGTVDLRFYGVYTVTINRRDRPVEVHSLTLEQCEICAADLLNDTYSVWDGTTYLQRSDRYAEDPSSFLCGVVLDLVAPTVLLVWEESGTMGIGRN